MRFLADENVPLPSVHALRAAGHDVHAVADPAAAEFPLAGLPDPEVLALAGALRGVLLTFDRDFGELVFRAGVSGSPGVVYFRFSPSTPTEPAEVLLALLERSGLVLEGYFTVADRAHVRQRRLPPSRPAV